MEIIVYRSPPIASEHRALPAKHYNLARSLQARSPRGVAFVPVRSMQMLAILDAEEFVFLDAHEKQRAVLAWGGFRPQQRTGLDQPVAYEALYYRADARELMGRLQPELFKAMQALAAKDRAVSPARVLFLERKAGSSP